MSSSINLPSLLVAIVALLLAWQGVFKAAAVLLGFFGAFSPRAKAAAAWCNTAANDLHIVGEAIGNVFPGSVGAKMRAAAKNAAKVVGVFVFVSLAAGTTGCSWFASHPAVAPDAQALEVCVETEIAKDAPTGETAIQVAVDVGAACGSQAATLIEAALTKSAAGPKSKAAVLRAARARLQ